MFREYMHVKMIAYCTMVMPSYIKLRECSVCKFPTFKVLKGGAADDMTDDSEYDMDTYRRSKKKRQKKQGRKDIPVKVC
jgi:hypothetical protein